jgi:hypothetical protein
MVIEMGLSRYELRSFERLRCVEEYVRGLAYEGVETRPHRRAWSKSLVRVGAECHEESR